MAESKKRKKVQYWTSTMDQRFLYNKDSKCFVLFYSILFGQTFTKAKIGPCTGLSHASVKDSAFLPLFFFYVNPFNVPFQVKAASYNH